MSRSEIEALRDAFKTMLPYAAGGWFLAGSLAWIIALAIVYVASNV